MIRDIHPGVMVSIIFLTLILGPRLIDKIILDLTRKQLLHPSLIERYGDRSKI